MTPPPLAVSRASLASTKGHVLMCRQSHDGRTVTQTEHGRELGGGTRHRTSSMSSEAAITPHWNVECQRLCCGSK
jgi:hypothetical protein